MKGFKGLNRSYKERRSLEWDRWGLGSSIKRDFFIRGVRCSGMFYKVKV